jgi:hypothetical protein
MCFPEKGDGHLCTDKDGDDTERLSGCAEGVKSISYEIFDVAKGSRTLRVTHDDGMDQVAKPAERTQLSVSGGNLIIKGPGCSESIPLAVAPPTAPAPSRP